MDGCGEVCIRVFNFSSNWTFWPNPPSDYIQPLPIPTLVWDEVPMDFIIGRTLLRGFEVILVIGDHQNQTISIIYLLNSQPWKLLNYLLIWWSNFMVFHHLYYIRLWPYLLKQLLKGEKKLFELSDTTLCHNFSDHLQIDG